MLKKVLLGIFLTSCLYFALYLFSITFRFIVVNGGIWAYIHVIMSIILFLGLFLFIVSVLHYLFVE
ncbi:MAG: pyrimidine-nucleoside phosphorylase [Carnobacterium sp.]